MDTKKRAAQGAFFMGKLDGALAVLGNRHGRGGLDDGGGFRGGDNLPDIFEDGDDLGPAGGEDQRADLINGEMGADGGIDKKLGGFAFGGAVLLDAFAGFRGALVAGEVNAADGFEPEQGNAFHLRRAGVVAHLEHELGDGFELNRSAAFDIDHRVAMAVGQLGQTIVSERFCLSQRAKKLRVIHASRGVVSGWIRLSTHRIYHCENFKKFRGFLHKVECE